MRPGQSADTRSTVGPTPAMRARDVSRPDDDDMAVAEASVEVSYRPRREPSGQEPSSGRAGS